MSPIRIVEMKVCTGKNQPMKVIHLNVDTIEWMETVTVKGETKTRITLNSGKKFHTDWTIEKVVDVILHSSCFHQ